MTRDFASARRRTRVLLFAAQLTVALALSGCASTKYVTVRKEPKNPLASTLQLYSPTKASERTMQLLRRYDLTEQLDGDPRDLVEKLQQINDAEPAADKMYAVAEISYRAGKRSEMKNQKAALDYYGTSVAYSYLYLFDGRFAPLRNPYDPQFRGACDLYNGALESALRIIRKQNSLTPGHNYTIETATQSFDCEVVLKNPNWHDEDFERFEFVSDYDVKGLTNQYQSFGLGVPLIAIRKQHEADSPAEKHYPPGLSFPVTALLRLLPDEGSAGELKQGQRHRAVLELYDPLVTNDITVGDRRVPLQSDLSTPLAYYLNNPKLNRLDTLGLIMPSEVAKISGLYMVQPYEPGKIPVIMVHGLWSSPITWTEMFNDLRSDPVVRENYQIWFYLYPTGQPFWNSATKMRADLAAVRDELDPSHQEAALDQMVLVGHSMGGLVSRMQTLDSGDEFWHIESDAPFADIKASAEERERLAKLFYFQPNSSIRRVVTIGTPHRGSKFANEFTRYLAQKFIQLPQLMLMQEQTVVRDNPGVWRDTTLINHTTSIDSLAPDSPILPVMLRVPTSPVVKYHNIIGVVPREGLFGRLAEGTDGVVAYESARLDNAASELIVPADHSTVHRHPRSVLEVRRILIDHLAEVRGSQPLRFAPPPTGGYQVGPAVSAPAMQDAVTTTGALSPNQAQVLYAAPGTNAPPVGTTIATQAIAPAPETSLMQPGGYAPPTGALLPPPNELPLYGPAPAAAPWMPPIPIPPSTEWPPAPTVVAPLISGT